MDTEIGFADALQRVFPTTVSSDLPFRGWICQETLCDGSPVTFDLRQCGVPYVPAAQDLGHTPALQNAQEPDKASELDSSLRNAGKSTGLTTKAPAPYSDARAIRSGSP